jgi:hypothetical protein
MPVMPRDDPLGEDHDRQEHAGGSGRNLALCHVPERHHAPKAQAMSEQAKRAAEKWCNACRRWVTIEGFYRNRARRDGLSSECKACSIRNALRYSHSERGRAMAATPDRVAKRNAKDAAWQKTAAGLANGRRQARAYRLRHPEKTHARALAKSAVRWGRLVRRPCEVCGLGDTHAHHDDYSRPLDVRWLCRRHHQEWHNANGR